MGVIIGSYSISWYFARHQGYKNQMMTHILLVLGLQIFATRSLKHSPWHQRSLWITPTPSSSQNTNCFSFILPSWSFTQFYPFFLPNLWFLPILPNSPPAPIRKSNKTLVFGEWFKMNLRCNAFCLCQLFACHVKRNLKGTRSIYSQKKFLDIGISGGFHWFFCVFLCIFRLFQQENMRLQAYILLTMW